MLSVFDPRPLGYPNSSDRRHHFKRYLCARSHTPSCGANGASSTEQPWAHCQEVLSAVHIRENTPPFLSRIPEYSSDLWSPNIVSSQRKGYGSAKCASSAHTAMSYYKPLLQTFWKSPPSVSE
eukprot:1875680-Amphidinium_carterae.1